MAGACIARGTHKPMSEAAIDLDVPAPVITLALFERFHSRRPESFAAKIFAAIRKGFGGHAVKAAD